VHAKEYKSLLKGWQPSLAGLATFIEALFLTKNNSMQFAACVVSVAPIRKSPAHESELINQLVFGEAMEVLDIATSNWWRIKSLHDQYEGWVSNIQVKEIDEKLALSTGNWLMESTGIAEKIQTDSGSMNIPFGASLTGFNGKEGRIGNFSFQYNGSQVRKKSELVADTAGIHKLVERWLEAPYLWGGRTMMGVDCSGLTQMIYKLLGIDLLRDASQQASQGISVDFLQQAQCGDLAFFDDAAGQIYHVGILINSQEIVHASGKVRKDTIDSAGIVNKDTGQRTHQLRIIKRYF